MTDAVPFINRVPCVNDEVVFPETNSYKVRLTRSWSVNDIEIFSKNLNNTNLQIFLESSQENIILENNFQLTVDSFQCPATGCMCGYYKYKEEICSSFKCPPVTKDCQSVIQPWNDCCQRCGKLLIVDLNSQFKFQHCWNVFSLYLIELMEQDKRRKVLFYMTKISEEKVQVILSDTSSNGEDSTFAATALKEEFDLHRRDNSSNCWSFKVKLLEGSEPAVANRQTQGEDRSKNVAVAVILPIIFALLLVVAYIIHRRRKEKTKIPVVRFKNEEFDGNIVGLEGVQYTNFNDMGENVMSSNQSMGYTNPIFNEMEENYVVDLSKKDIPNIQIIDSPPPSYKEKDPSNIEVIGAANPLYEEFHSETVDLPHEQTDRSVKEANAKETLLNLSRKSKDFFEKSFDSQC